MHPLFIIAHGNCSGVHDPHVNVYHTHTSYLKQHGLTSFIRSRCQLKTVTEQCYIAIWAALQGGLEDRNQLLQESQPEEQVYQSVYSSAPAQSVHQADLHPNNNPCFSTIVAQVAALQMCKVAQARLLQLTTRKLL